MNESIQDESNRRAWNSDDVRGWFANKQGFIGSGERAAYWRIADEVRGTSILDLGVGGGRTIPFLRSLTTHYVALDYLPSMVDAVRQAYPFVDSQVGDARDLSRFPDASFGLVVFSCRGVDAVRHEDRPRILREVNRILQPNGIFWFSTLNKDGPLPHLRPWKLQPPRRGIGKADLVLWAIRGLKRFPAQTINYRRLRAFQRSGDGWLVAPFYPHDYRLLVHYTTLAHQLDELKSAGFKSECDVFDEVTGALVQPTDDLTGVPSFEILARK